MVKAKKTYQYSVPAVFSKADIPKLGAMIGQVNSLSLSWAGVATAFGPKSVKFCNVEGSLNKTDGKYHGVFQFCDAVSGEDCKTFAALPGMSGWDVSKLTRKAADGNRNIGPTDNSGR